MAIAIAQGGRYRRDPQEHVYRGAADQVDRVKRSENGVIVNPFFLSPDHLVADANELMGKYKISGVPVCRDGKLVGILTNRDMRFLTDFSQRIEEVMTRKIWSRRRSAPLSSRRRRSCGSHRIEKLPIVDGQGMLKGLITIKDIEKAVKYPNSARDKDGRLLCAAAIGATADVLERAGELVKAQVDALCSTRRTATARISWARSARSRRPSRTSPSSPGKLATADARPP